MAKRRSKKRKQELILKLAIVVVLILISYFGYEFTQGASFFDVINNWVASLSTSNSQQIERKNVKEDEKADSILVMQENQVMLVDCGTRAKGSTVVNYLKQLGIDKIDVLVGTHFHDDHIGGMAEVIRNFEIGTLYTPNNLEEEITTYWYLDFLDAVDEKNVNWVYPEVGTSFSIGDASVQIIAPNSKKYNNMNNYSIVLMVTYGESDILLMGDAENLSEEEIMNNSYFIDADVIKIGHHGSNRSSSEKFLKEVNPQYAIISAGKGNIYNHPTKTVMERLKKLGIVVYRTDESGTIIMTTNGNNISFNVEAGDYLSRDKLN